jgi:mono/diheme cytochrome c family protein
LDDSRENIFPILTQEYFSMKIGFRCAASALALMFVVAPSLWAGPAGTPSVEHGRYIISTAGCNDCHTAGYAETMGQVPETEWLKGDMLGWRGPWGTTYPANLRLSLATKTEDQWVAFAHSLQSRPPMPSFSLNRMTEEDLRSIYLFVRQLQPLGDPAPAWVPPDVVPNPPFVQFPMPPPAAK